MQYWKTRHNFMATMLFLAGGGLFTIVPARQLLRMTQSTGLLLLFTMCVTQRGGGGLLISHEGLKPDLKEQVSGGELPAPVTLPAS